MNRDTPIAAVSTDSAAVPSAHVVLSDADRKLIRNPQTQARRRQLAGYLPMIRLQLNSLSANAPSYVVDAVHGLLDAFDRWTADEQANA